MFERFGLFYKPYLDARRLYWTFDCCQVIGLFYISPWSVQANSRKLSIYQLLANGRDGNFCLKEIKSSFDFVDLSLVSQY